MKEIRTKFYIPDQDDQWLNTNVGESMETIRMAHPQQFTLNLKHMDILSEIVLMWGQERFFAHEALIVFLMQATPVSISWGFHFQAGREFKDICKAVCGQNYSRF